MSAGDYGFLFSCMAGIIVWSILLDPNRGRRKTKGPSGYDLSHGAATSTPPPVTMWPIQYPPDTRLDVALRALRSIANDYNTRGIELSDRFLDQSYGNDQRLRDAASYGHLIGVSAALVMRSDQAAAALAEIEKMGQGCAKMESDGSE